MPIIWIGGMPRSGTTLMRAMLDAHPSVRCGEETRVLPRILGMHAQWKRNVREATRLQEAGLDDTVIDAAISGFITEIIVRHGAPAARLCNKDPFTLKSVAYLRHLFPRSKFLLMIRDGRATVHSIISRKVTITGFDLKNPKQCLEKWNAAVEMMYNECIKAGGDVCMPVPYEQLVLQPLKWTRDILNFLNLPWNASVLNHEQFIGDKISLSMVERSTDQIIKPINTDALSKWVGFYPADVVRDMASIAPMLARLGYDPTANPPVYGQPDEHVKRKTEDVHNNEAAWKEKVGDIMNKQKRVQDDIQRNIAKQDSNNNNLPALPVEADFDAEQKAKN
ncbi:unnamed protein product [Sphagnum balticum]